MAQEVHMIDSPTSITRPPRLMPAGVSPSRRAVESALQEAGVALTAHQLVERSGVGIDQVRIHLSTLSNKNLAHNTTPGGRPGVYLWGPAPSPVAQGAVAAPRAPLVPYSSETDSYQGGELRPFAGRPGAMVAFTLPSIVNGQPVERARPLLISAGKAVKP
jgi:hypothetical protein